MVRKADFIHCDGKAQEGLKQGNDRVWGFYRSTLTTGEVMRGRGRNTGEVDDC